MPRKREISDALIDEVCVRLSKNLRVRRTLPMHGRLHIDRQLPFLCVYRRPDDNDLGTERLVKGEASYLIAPGAARFRKRVSALVRGVAKTLSDEFGAFLILQLWAAPEGGKANDPAVPSVLPTITIHAPKASAAARTVEVLVRRLKKIKILKQGVLVEVVHDGKADPPAMSPLLKSAEVRDLSCLMIGLALPPVYRSRDLKLPAAATNRVSQTPAKPQNEFPLILRSLTRSLGLALRQTFFEFARSQTTHRPPHYHALGRKAVVKSVWDVDRQLANVSNSFDYLLQLTPVNAMSAWKQFRRERFERVPEFHYRPLPIDPGLLKRELFKIPIERVEDPALQHLFEEKQDELDLKLNMLRDRDTPRFLYESLQVFGGVEDELLELAKGMLARLQEGKRKAKSGNVNAKQFARRAESEIEFYRSGSPAFKAKAVISGEVSGLIVSRGKLLINEEMSVPESRVEALLQHEVGTHLLTYYNGRVQPFQQLYSGLAGYEELQEGLAVLSEYLVGGLSRGRMRQLAARVIATRCLTDGASFVETFRTLDDSGFAQQTAYSITMRVFRGGGLTKDAVYLRGLQAILPYIQKGGDLDPLFVGKIAVDHIPIIKELQYRKVLAPAPVRPRYMDNPVAAERLARLRNSNATVLDLVSEE